MATHSSTTTTNIPAVATRRVVLGIKEAADLEEPDLPSESMPLNMGPSHPAMHGTVRMVLEVEGAPWATAQSR